MAPRFLTEQLVESGEMGRLGMHIFGKKKKKKSQLKKQVGKKVVSWKLDISKRTDQLNPNKMRSEKSPRI